MTLISKTAGALSLSSCIIDMHKCGVISSKNSAAKTSANVLLSDSIGSQKANRISYKDATIKNFSARNNFGITIKESVAKVTGYLKGFFEAGARYIPNFALAVLALVVSGGKTDNAVARNAKIANAAALGLGIVEGYDILKNSTNFGQRTDYLNYR